MSLVPQKPNPDCPNCNCSYNSESLKNQPMGMFHCPLCGQMIVAGIPHPKVCDEHFDYSGLENEM